MLRDILQVTKATCASVIFVLIYSLVFAGAISLFNLPSHVIKPVNQVFKVIAIAFGGMLFLRGERGLFKGVLLGVSAVVLTWLLFCIIAGAFTFGWTMLLEVVIGAFAGGISGIIAVNVKKE